MNQGSASNRINEIFNDIVKQSAPALPDPVSTVVQAIKQYLDELAGEPLWQQRQNKPSYGSRTFVIYTKASVADPASLIKMAEWLPNGKEIRYSGFTDLKNLIAELESEQ